MFKLAAAVLDFYDDPDFQANPTASRLMGASLVPLEKVALLKDSDFAVRILTKIGAHRKFPVYNKASTAISGEYFDKIASELPPEIRNTAGFFLKLAHRRHGVQLPPSLEAEFDPVESNTVRYEQPPEEATVVGARSIVKLAEYVFVNNQRSMSALEKVAKAAEIDETAKASGTEVEEPEVWNYVPKDKFGPHFKEMLRQREVAVSENGMLKEAFSKMLEDLPRHSVKQIPFIIHQFDKLAEFDTRYGIRGIMDPFFGTWGDIPKVAGPQEDIFKHKLATLARSGVLDGVFSERLASAFSRDPVGAYETMSPEERKVVDWIITKIPSNLAEGDTQATANKSPELWTEWEKAVKSLREKQTAPSDRPDRSIGAQSVPGGIARGL